MGSKEKRKPIEKAVEELKENMETVARVDEWARLMGYKRTRLFSRHFLRHFRIRPSEVLKEVRLRSIIKQLRDNGSSGLEVAVSHSLPNEKGMNNFVRRHLGVSPTKIKMMSDKELQGFMEKFGSKNGE